MIFICKQKNVKDFLKKIGMLECKLFSTLAEQNVKMCRHEGEDWKMQQYNENW